MPEGPQRDREPEERDPPHRPHVDESAREGSVQEERPEGREAPTLPATAHGQDRVPAEEQALPTDDESMYDRRPEESKDDPPSDRARE